MSLLFTKSNTLLLLVFLFLIHIGCRKQRYVEETETTNGDILSMNDLKVPNGFNYETFKESNIRIMVKNAQGDVYNNATIYIMDNSFELGGQILAKGVTDANGYLALKVDLPLSLKQLVINTNALNIPADVVIENRDYIELTMGGPDYNPNTVQNPMSLTAGFLGKSPGKVSTRLGTWNMSTGKPNYLQMPNDVITTNFLSSVNSFLPSSVNLPNRYPTFLDDNYYRRNILLTNTAEVFITFVKEGAGQLNTLFYYVYNVNYPPQKTSDIDSLIIIYPNTSFTGSGGDLATGNKVRLGQFGKDTVIAFGIIANGFNSSNGTIADINTRPVFYGNKALNPETNDAYKQHLVFVYEPNTQRFVLGFEDVNRNPAGSSDNDFEDVVYYATINNINNVNLEKIAILPGSVDSDGDGVDDTNDDYPIDPLKAFNNYYPSAQQTATVAFEDLWYFKGDYDMNDMVLDMRTNVITNAGNKVVEYQGKYFLRASGGSLKSAFAVQFPVAPGAVSNITGASDEPNQSNLVLKVFDNVRNEQATWNTIASQGYVDSIPYTVSFKLTTPVDISTFGIGLHNPFIWLNEADRGRGWEIHLPGKPATSLADIALYTQGDDDTQVSGSKKYLTKNNLPWAIATPERFDYPLEKEDITQTYLNFANWAQSAGTNYKDWYKNLPNYRNTTKIYVKP